MKNLEIKVRVSNIENITDKISFATYVKEMHQKDRYFLLGKNRLKLREEGNNLEVIFYVRPDKSNSRESTYFRFSIPSFLQKSFRKSCDIIFGEKVEVVKERKLYLFKNTRIHLDKVKNLGEFVELETVFQGNDTKDSFVAEHDQVKKNLGLDMYEAIPTSYSDLVLENKR